MIEHRHETRGVGGIFFDDLGGADDAARERLFGFVTDCAKVGTVYSAAINSVLVRRGSRRAASLEWRGGVLSDGQTTGMYRSYNGHMTVT